MDSEKFCLRWNDFESNISNAFKEVRNEKDFFDVTIACDDDQIQAHKVILSACSPFFRNILLRNPHQHPLLYMKGVKFTDLQSVLNFMYHGEVNVAQEELNSFLAVAEDLRVKGLTQNQSVFCQSNSEQSTSNQLSTSPPATSKALTLPIKSEHAPHCPPKRSRPPPPPSISEDDYIQEIDPIKSEPISSVPHASPQTHPQAYSTVSQDQSVTAYQEVTGYEDNGDYQGEQGYTETSNESTMNKQGKGLGSDRSVLNEYVKKEVINGRSVSVCTMCGKSNTSRPNIMNHVESVHFPNTYTYTCKYCGKMYNAKNSLNVHISTIHRGEKSSY